MSQVHRAGKLQGQPTYKGQVKVKCGLVLIYTNQCVAITANQMNFVIAINTTQIGHYHRNSLLPYTVHNGAIRVYLHELIGNSDVMEAC